MKNTLQLLCIVTTCIICIIATTSNAPAPAPITYIAPARPIETKTVTFGTYSLTRNELKEIIDKHTKAGYIYKDAIIVSETNRLGVIIFERYN